MHQGGADGLLYSLQQGVSQRQWNDPCQDTVLDIEQIRQIGQCIAQIRAEIIDNFIPHSLRKSGILLQINLKTLVDSLQIDQLFKWFGLRDIRPRYLKGGDRHVADLSGFMGGAVPQFPIHHIADTTSGTQSKINKVLIFRTSAA